MINFVDRLWQSMRGGVLAYELANNASKHDAPEAVLLALSKDIESYADHVHIYTVPEKTADLFLSKLTQLYTDF